MSLTTASSSLYLVHRAAGERRYDTFSWHLTARGSDRNSKLRHGYTCRRYWYVRSRWPSFLLSLSPKRLEACKYKEGRMQPDRPVSPSNTHRRIANHVRLRLLDWSLGFCFGDARHMGRARPIQPHKRRPRYLHWSFPYVCTLVS